MPAFDASLEATQSSAEDLAAGLYATIWRWHFYAALFVVPFALLLAATGAIYLFKPQIETLLYADLYKVPAAAQSIGADAQLSAALAQFPNSTPEAYTPPADATRSALVRLLTADGREMTVAVDPHRGTVLGAIDDQWRLMQVVRDLHGTLLAGEPGQALQELAASWAMVMLVTGLFLWWPRGAGVVWGVILPRLGARGRIFWRDLHAVTGIWMSVLLIFLVATGLPWTLVSGALFTELAGQLGKGMPDNGIGWGNGGSMLIKSDPQDQGWATTHAEHMAGLAHSAPAAGATPLPLRRIVAIAREMNGIAPPFEIRLPVDASGVYSIVTDSELRPENLAYVHLDQYTGRVIADIRWRDFGPLARGITLGVSLHEGLYFGWPNQLLGLVACLGLIALVIAGATMWWRRRPAGGLGAPRPEQPVRIGYAIVAAAFVLGVIMPLMGLSLVAILLVEWLRRRRRVALSTAAALALAVGLAPAPSRAQTSSADQSSQIPEVVVTATRSERSLSDVPASVSVVTGDEINSTPAQELDDALRIVPGVDLLGYSGEAQHPTSDSLGMRGLGGTAQGISRALVMVDGIPINDPFFGYIQWGRVPLETIDRVEIVRGGGSPLWGNYAEGGVINVITKEPTTQQAIFDASGGSYGTYRASGYGTYVPAGIMKFQGFAGVTGTGGFQQVPEIERAPFNVPTSYQAVNLQLRDTVAPSDDLIGHVSLYYHDNHQQLETILDKNNQQLYTVTSDLKKMFGDGGSLAGTAFYSNSSFTTDNSTYFPNAADLALTTQNLNEVHDVRANDVGGSLIWSQDLTGVVKKYMIGTDLHYVSGIDHTDHFIAPDFTPTYFNTVGHGDQTFLAGFAQATVSPLERLEVTVSGRFQYLLNSNGYDGSLGGVGAVPDRTFTSFDPRVDLRYSLADGLALRGAFYESFRAPNIGDQFYTYAAGGFVQLPAPSLRPEKLKGGEVGLDYTWRGLRSQFTLYRTNIGNYIVIEPTTSPIYSPQGWYVVQNMNIAAVQAQGFETEVNWDIGGGFSTNLAYTLADSVVKSNPVDPLSIGQQIIDVPRNRVAASLTYKDTKGWKVSTQVSWVDRTDWASPDHTDPGYPGKIAADSHFLVDVSGSYPVTQNVEVYLKIQNLLDRNYIATSYSAPSAQVKGAPFEIFSGVRLTF